MLHKHGSSRPHSSLLYKGRGAFLKSVSTLILIPISLLFSFLFPHPIFPFENWTFLSSFRVTAFLSKIQPFLYPFIFFSSSFRIKKNVGYRNWSFARFKLFKFVTRCTRIQSYCSIIFEGKMKIKGNIILFCIYIRNFMQHCWLELVYQCWFKWVLYTRES